MKNRLLAISSIFALLLSGCLPAPKSKGSSGVTPGASDSNQPISGDSSSSDIASSSSSKEESSSSSSSLVPPPTGQVDATKIKDYTIEQIVNSTVFVDNYYSSVRMGSIKSDLESLAKKDYKTVDYDDAEEYMRITDRDWVRSPNVDDENPYMILLYYSKNNDSSWQQLWNHYHTSESKHGIPESQQSWDKEHIWAKSNGSLGDNSDLHHLRASDRNGNNQRQSFPLAKVENFTKYIQDFSGTNISKLGKTKNVTVCEPLDQYKGDVARALMYLPLAISKLSLTNETDSSGGKWGFLSDLIAWHKADPVDTFELRRNSLVQYYQGNRNPFIDHPEWVEKVYSV